MALLLFFAAGLLLALRAGVPGEAERRFTAAEGEKVVLCGRIVRSEERESALWLYTDVEELEGESARSIRHGHIQVIVKVPRTQKAAGTRAENAVTSAGEAGPDTGTGDRFADTGESGAKGRAEESEPLPGYRVRVRGTASVPDEARNEGGFDYRLYYRSRGIIGTVKAQETEVLPDAPDSLRLRLHRLRRAVSDLIGQICPPGEAGLCRSLFLGERWEAPQKAKDLLQSGGLGHLLAISGLHVSLLGMTLYRALRRLAGPTALCAAAGALVIGAYALMVGASPGAVRAAVSYGALVFSEGMGRSYDSLSANSLAGLINLMLRPLLITQASFLLSYAAVLGIALYVPDARAAAAHRPRGKKKNAVTEALDAAREGVLTGALTTLSVSLCTLPVLLSAYSAFPLQGILLNVAFLPFFGAVMGVGAAGIAAGALVPEIGRILFVPVSRFLRLILSACEIAQGHPAPVLTGRPLWWQLMLCAAGMLALKVFLMRAAGRKPILLPGRSSRTERRLPRRRIGAVRLCALFAVSLVLALALFSFRPRLGRLRIVMLDVGQGDGIVLMLPNGADLLVDGGSSDDPDVAGNVIGPFLDANGIRRVRAAFLSHMDKDHVSGALALAEQGRVEKLYVTPQTAADEAFRIWRESRGRNCPVEVLTAEETAARKVPYGMEEEMGAAESVRTEFSAAGSVRPAVSEAGAEMAKDGAGEDLVRLEVLWPAASGAGAALSDNAASMVLHLSFGDFSMLLTGDLEGEGEAVLTRVLKGKPVTALKAAHHGSRFSTGEPFLEAVRPQIALISCGRNNRYGHPHAETLERLAAAGCRVFGTPSCGQTDVETDGKRVRIRTFLRVEEEKKQR
ncbi:MAG: DNA internalization-related competence protein ComEC/Rec2 [Lachnospiraceae bacterium]|nr:DNA internalization-related competence protein ComEC/Rec2 [Lachnospiraceae bacterium]